MHAEWTTFRAVRGRVLGMTAAALVIGLLGVLFTMGSNSSCSKGEVEVACQAAPVGPSGEAVSDRFYFVHQPLTGNGSMTVRLTSMTGRIKQPPPAGTSGPGPEPVPGMTPWAKAGVMIKDGVRQGARYAAVMLTAEHGVRMQYNFTHDTAGRSGGVSADPPVRLNEATVSERTLVKGSSLDAGVGSASGGATAPAMPVAASMSPAAVAATRQLRLGATAGAPVPRPPSAAALSCISCSFLKRRIQPSPVVLPWRLRKRFSAGAATRPAGPLPPPAAF
jgi:hypothetical protein